MNKKVFLFILFFAPSLVSADMVISEIMYDLAEGSDSGREWIEVYNNGAEAMDISDWRFYEAETNHKINLFDENGSFVISAGSYVVIADNPSNFLIDWPNFSGTVFDSSFSLHNTGESLVVRDADLNDIDSVVYSSDWGAGGDGNSLQKSDGGWIAAIPTPGAQNSSENAAPPADESQEPSSTTNGGDSGWPEYVPPEDRPKFSAYAGKDMTLIVGALGEFKGEGYDFDGNLIEDGRYLWSFGDGSMKEGRNISYSYRYPGEYIVTLDVSSGKNSASDRLIVKVIPNEIIISEVKPGAESFAEIYNGSKEEINISGWQIRSGSQKFNLPKNTFIKPLGYSVFPVFLSGVNIPLGVGKVDLLYQTGAVADSFLYSGILTEHQSFNCPTSDMPRSKACVEQIYIARETPGSVNTKPEFSAENSNMQKPEETKNYESRIINQEEEAMATGTESLPVEVSTKAGLEANVINAADSEPGKSSLAYYLLGVVALIFFSALGLVFVRRKSPL